MIFPTIAVMTTLCYIRFLHFCEFSLISESTSLRLVRSMLAIWTGSLPQAGRQPGLHTLTVVTINHLHSPIPHEVLLSWKYLCWLGCSVPFLLFSATGIFVETPETTKVRFSPNRNLCSHPIGNPIPWIYVFSPHGGTTAPPSTFPTLLSHSPLGFLVTKKLPPVSPLQ